MPTFISMFKNIWKITFIEGQNVDFHIFKKNIFSDHNVDFHKSKCWKRCQNADFYVTTIFFMDGWPYDCQHYDCRHYDCQHSDGIPYVCLKGVWPDKNFQAKKWIRVWQIPFFFTKYKYWILFGFQKSPNTEYQILFSIEKIWIPNTEYYSVSRTSEYQIRIVLFGLTIQIPNTKYQIVYNI